MPEMIERVARAIEANIAAGPLEARLERAKAPPISYDDDYDDYDDGPERLI